MHKGFALIDRLRVSFTVNRESSLLIPIMFALSSFYRELPSNAYIIPHNYEKKINIIIICIKHVPHAQLFYNYQHKRMQQNFPLAFRSF